LTLAPVQAEEEISGSSQLKGHGRQLSLSQVGDGPILFQFNGLQPRGLSLGVGGQGGELRLVLDQDKGNSIYIDQLPFLSFQQHSNGVLAATDGQVEQDGIGVVFLD